MDAVGTTVNLMLVQPPNTSGLPDESYQFCKNSFYRIQEYVLTELASDVTDSYLTNILEMSKTHNSYGKPAGEIAPSVPFNNVDENAI